MANQEQLRILLSGPKKWNQWREDNPDVIIDLTDAGLTRMNLTRINLADADLTDADLTDMNLTGANLTRADLTDAYLTRALLTGADLTRTNLTRTNLTRTNLTRVILARADLTNVKIKNPIPKIKNLKQKILNEIEKNPESFDMNSWNTCETTHCLAGWAVAFAEEAGKALQNELTTAGAGACIFFESCGGVPYFYSDNEKAIQWLKK